MQQMKILHETKDNKSLFLPEYGNPNLYIGLGGKDKIPSVSDVN